MASTLPDEGLTLHGPAFESEHLQAKFRVAVVASGGAGPKEVTR